ncbi:hypothetical protein B0T13DRAFT_473804 [Neurospora crassa]|nr:hypothetical protein B0T13DRAFT_473804 [Neurospora crassa]
MPPSDDGVVNLLSLDGGGVRGVCELVILDRIMQRVQERDSLDEIPKPCDYFHLMGGTSTGGLIAILLGRLRMSTTEALKEYDNFAGKIFSRWNRRLDLSAKFDEKTLVKVVQTIVKERGEDPLMKDPKGDPLIGKAFVCAQRSGNIAAIRRIRAYQHGQAEESDRNITIDEAARATSAAPTFFKPAKISDEELIDGAIGCNNPTEEVIHEAAEVLDKTCKIGCVLSLGTGFRNKSLKSVGNLPLASLAWAKRMMGLLKEETTDCERAHRDAEKRFTDFPDTYFRFNVPDVADQVKLHKYKKIPLLKEATTRYLETPAVKEWIEKVVDILTKGTTSGLTVGQAAYPDINQLITDKRRSQARGQVSKFFTGRREILEKMSAFFIDNTESRREFLLLGMGGVGKTQIALKFAADHSDMFKPERVFWVDATDAATIFDSYHMIYDQLFPNEKNGQATHTGRARITKVHEWMQQHGDGWLLILDNYGPDKGLSQYIPPGNRGNIIYTSRFASLKQLLPRDAFVQVNELNKEDAITLLLRAAREPPENAEYRNACLPIVEALGCLPLAIDQAGAFVYATQCSFPDYLENFHQVKDSLLRQPEYVGSNEQNAAVYTTFNLSYYMLEAFQRLRGGVSKAKAAKSAIKILNTICFYHNQGIMEEMVSRAAEYRFRRGTRNLPMPEGESSIQDLLQVGEEGHWNPTGFRKAVELLDSFSLLKKERGHQISMHVLVHLWARERMGKDQRNAFGMSARVLIHDSIPMHEIAGDRDDSLFRRRLYPHSEACENHTECRLDEAREIFLKGKRTILLEAMGKDEEAIDSWKSLIDTCKDLYTIRDVRTFEPMGRLAHLYMRTSRYEEAEPLMQELVERKAEKFGAQHTQVIAALSDLQTLYLHMGRLAEAREQAVTIVGCLQANGSKEQLALIPSTVQSIRALDDLMQKSVSFEDGTWITPGPPPPHVAGFGAGNNNKEHLTPTEAGEAYRSEQTALWAQYSDFKEAFGSSSLDALALLNRIFDHMRQHNHNSCAEIVAEECVQRALARYGREAHQTNKQLHNLAKATLCLGDAERAVSLGEEVLGYYTEGLGVSSERTRRVVAELANWRGVCEERRKLVATGIRIRERWETWHREHTEAELREIHGDEGYEKMKGDQETLAELLAERSFPDVCREECMSTGFVELYERLGITGATRYVHHDVLKNRQRMNELAVEANQAQNRDTRDLEVGLLTAVVGRDGEYAVAVEAVGSPSTTTLAYR